MMITATRPNRPSSSPTAAAMKSLLATGTWSGRPPPRPPPPLADRGGDEVALGHRHLVGAATAQPGAEQPAGAQAEQRLRHLETRAVVVLEGVQPGVHALLHVAEQLGGEQRAAAGTGQRR